MRSFRCSPEPSACCRCGRICGHRLSTAVVDGPGFLRAHSDCWDLCAGDVVLWTGAGAQCDSRRPGIPDPRVVRGHVSRRRGVPGTLLVAAQVVVSCVLLAVAALQARTLLASTMATATEPERVLLVEVDPGRRGTDGASVEDVLSLLTSMPGVVSAGAASSDGLYGPSLREGRCKDGPRDTRVALRHVAGVCRHHEGSSAWPGLRLVRQSLRRRRCHQRRARTIVVWTRRSSWTAAAAGGVLAS